MIQDLENEQQYPLKPKRKRKYGRACTDYLVISHLSVFYQIWSILVIIASIICTPYYLYLAAFGLYLEKEHAYINPIINDDKEFSVYDIEWHTIFAYIVEAIFIV